MSGPEGTVLPVQSAWTSLSRVAFSADLQGTLPGTAGALAPLCLLAKPWPVAPSLLQELHEASTGPPAALRLIPLGGTCPGPDGESPAGLVRSPSAAGGRQREEPRLDGLGRSAGLGWRGAVGQD